MRIFWTFAVLTCACHFDPGGARADVSADGSIAGAADGSPFVASDADLSLPDAEPLGAFGAPQLIPELSAPGATNDDPTLTADMLEIYFNSDRGGNADIWRSTRADANDAWSPPELVAEVSSGSRESDPEVSLDGLTLRFSSSRSGGSGGQDIWEATRASSSDPWSDPVLVTGINSAEVDAAATWDVGDQRIVLYSGRPGGLGAADLWEGVRSGNGFSMTALIEVNSSSNDYDPFFDTTGRILFFDSDRPGGAGEQDLYVASRPTTSAAFSSPVPIAELNTSSRDMDPWLTPDLRTIVFASNRSGELEYYIATR